MDFGYYTWQKTRKSPSTATAAGNTATDYVLDRQSARRDAKNWA